MNEKIRELAQQSHVHGYMVHLYTINAPDGYRVPIEIRMKSLEKFAELIVKECAGVAEVSMPIASHPDDRLAVRNSILKHFGIEE